MTVQQLKSEISKTIENMPEEVLPGILDYLKELKEVEAGNASRVNLLKKILAEDSDLLHRLAQ